MKPGEKEVNTLLRNEASCLFFFKPPIRSRSPLLTRSRLISLPLATQMFQFAKFEKSKERRLATELGYGFPIGDPWITDGISPWPFASESVLPSQCPGIHPMHSFRSCTHGAVHWTPTQYRFKKERIATTKTTSNYINWGEIESVVSFLAVLALIPSHTIEESVLSLRNSKWGHNSPFFRSQLSASNENFSN
jgi:hypothetical protein